MAQIYIDDISQWSAGESLFQCIAEFQATLTERNAVHYIPSVLEGVKCIGREVQFLFLCSHKMIFFHFDKEYRSLQLRKIKLELLK